MTRAADKLGPFAAIRGGAQDGHSIRALAAQQQVHRRTIRQALAGPVPPRKAPQRTSALDRLRDPIIATIAAEPGLPVRQVWERLLDERHAGGSHATVRDYVMRLQAGTAGRET